MRVNNSSLCYNNFISHRDALSQIIKLEKLLQKYEKRKQSKYPVTSGGLQQYINKLSLLNSNSSVTSDSNRFQYLSDDIIQLIFLHLSSKDLQRAQLVSRQWHRLINDDIFWRRKLERDIHTWHCFGHDRNPTLFENGILLHRHDTLRLETRQIYYRCCPKSPLVVGKAYYAPSLTQYLRSLLPRKSPRLAMLGPGLESETGCITTRIMLDESCFSTVRMFPGHFGGMGTGFTYKMLTSRGIEYFDLTTVYTSSTGVQSERRYGRSHCSKLFIPSGNGVLELTRQARDFCLSLDGLIYVVDANCTNIELREACEELYALTQHFWAKPRVPILVLSLTKADISPRLHSCLDILEQLHMNHLNGIWKVYNGVSNSLKGIPEALSWIIEQCTCA